MGIIFLLISRVLANPVGVKNSQTLESASNLWEIKIILYFAHNIHEYLNSYPLLGNWLEIPLRLLLVDRTRGLGLTWGKVVLQLNLILWGRREDRGSQFARFGKSGISGITQHHEYEWCMVVIIMKEQIIWNERNLKSTHKKSWATYHRGIPWQRGVYVLPSSSRYGRWRSLAWPCTPACGPCPAWLALEHGAPEGFKY